VHCLRLLLDAPAGEEEVARRAVEEFGPMLSARPGFQGYWAIDAGDGIAATITVFDTEEQATESIAAAAGYVSENMAELVPNPPQITAGETTGIMAGAPA
jgi:hypothetical protein